MKRLSMERLSRARIAEDMDNLTRKREAEWEAARQAYRSNRPRERKLWNTGGSVVMALPKDFLDVLGWKAGDDVLVHLEGRRLIIE